MIKKEISELTDQELLEESKELKLFPVTNALIIGVLIGIVFYSIAKNSWGMLTLIPLYLAYKIINDPKNKRYRAIEELLKQRNLK